MRDINIILQVTLITMLIILVGRVAIRLDYSHSYEISSYRQVYEGSQYTGGAGLIPDQTVFAYAGGAYIQGVNPLKVNPEMPPLGKYLLGLSILAFGNTNHLILLCAVFTLVMLYILGFMLLNNSVASLIVVLLFASEKLFLDQLIISPLLDIIQLPFIFLSFYFFLRAVGQKKDVYFVAAGLALGFVASIKVMITAILIGASWVLYSVIRKQYKNLVKLVLITAPASFSVLVISYIRILIDNNSFWYFLLVQKWVFLYQQSKIQFPFSGWRLLMFNQWQAWWGDYSILHAVDWNICWPIVTVVSFGYIIYKILRKENWSNIEGIIASWILTYSILISFGTISTRYLLPFLPFLYLFSMKFLLDFLNKFR